MDFIVSYRGPERGRPVSLQHLQDALLSLHFSLSSASWMYNLTCCLLRLKGMCFRAASLITLMLADSCISTCSVHSRSMERMGGRVLESSDWNFRMELSSAALFHLSLRCGNEVSEVVTSVDRVIEIGRCKG